MLHVAGLAASIAALAISPAADEANLIEAPSTVQVGKGVNISLIGRVALRLRRGDDKLVVALQPTANRGQDGIGAVPSWLGYLSTRPEVVHITFGWPPFDNACSRTHCVRVRWHVNRRVDINVCAESPKGNLDVCARATATLRR